MSGHDAEIRKALLRWYKANRRSLPWRETQDPYAIWVSEVMLQQTRVETVIPYYERFLRTFPDVAALAAAGDDELMKAWEGLGYYARARNLREGARRVIADHNGLIPAALGSLRSLPGIGPYTAGAIASMAFGSDEPVLDGNVIRVVCRLFRVAENPGSSAVRRSLWNRCRSLLPRGKAGEFNQALMELGATVCLPGVPLCSTCPVSAWCEAFRRKEQDRLPRRIKRHALPHYDVGVAVIRRGRRILVTKRPPEGLLGGLWEFPGGKREGNESLRECVLREAKEELGIDLRVTSHLVTVKHAYTHFKVTLHAFLCTHKRGRPTPTAATDCRWMDVEALRELPFPRGSLKIMDALRDEMGRP